MKANEASHFDLSHGLRLSIGIHVGLLIAIVLQQWIFPSPVKTYTPALRVDLVGLPDVLKKDLDQIKAAALPLSAAPMAHEKKHREDHREEYREKDDTLVVPSKKDKKHSKEDAKNKRKEKLEKALARIKALSKITDDTPEVTAIKGNKISKGSALTGDAKESEPQYYDQVLGRIQEHWELPPWLARQNLSAQIQVFIDSKGRVRRTRLVKPSGNSAFDEAVKRAILESDPLPPPPSELQASTLSRGILFGFPL